MLPMAQAELDEAITSLVKRKYPRLKLTHEDMSEWLLGSECHTASVNAACLRLMKTRQLDRDGAGVAHDPFTYKPWCEPFERRI